MKRTSVFTFILMMAVQTVLAAVPSGYYSTIDNEKSTSLKSALHNIIKNHEVLSYNSLWQYYPATYYVTSNTTQVLDMYSPTVRYYTGSGNAVNGMNKEHTVPKSWWGGGSSCHGYSDLFNVIPSDQDANSRKSNHSLGKVKTQSWTNGVTTIGSGTVNGHSDTFFEPKDEYKGDFARIYFYMATCYSDAAWDTNDAKAMTSSSPLTLQSWIIPLLLEWNAADPVDADEVLRNENIYNIQKNRNPFIDFPELAEYIWGSKKDENFNLSEHNVNDGTGTSQLAAGNPAFSVTGGTQANPYLIADGSTVTVKTGNSSSVLYVSVNGDEWQQFTPESGYNSTSQTEYYINASTTVTITGTVSIKAYCTMEDRQNSETIEYWYRGVNYDNEYLLFEQFDEITAGNNNATSGSSSAWGGNDNFPNTSDKVYQAGNAVRLGTSKATGSITSRELDYAGGDVTVTIDVKGWTTVEGDLSVSLTGTDAQVVSYESTMSDDFQTVTLQFHEVSSMPRLTIATTAKRAFIDKVTVKGKSTTSVIETVDSNNAGSTSYVTYDLSGRISSPSAHGIVIVRAADGTVKKVTK